MNTLVDSHVINNTAIDGYTFESSFQPHGIGDIYANCNRVQFINDDKITAVNVDSFFANNTVLQEISFPLLRKLENFAFQNCSALTEVNMPLLEALSHGSFYGCSSLVGISLPSCETTWTDAFSNCAILKEVYLPKLGKNRFAGFASCPNLILIEIGRTATSFSTITLENWSPTNALDSSSSSLVDSGETFANNLEKLLYNIREHIAANLPDRTGLSSLTIRFSSAVKAAIQADAPTAAAFTNKNWVIA